MTPTLTEKLEALLRYSADGPSFVLDSDLRAIIDQHKREVPVCSHEPYHGKCVHCGIAFNGGVPSPQPDIVAELVKALEDDAYAASFQSMAGYRTALIAKVKGWLDE